MVFSRTRWETGEPGGPPVCIEAEVPTPRQPWLANQCPFLMLPFLRSSLAREFCPERKDGFQRGGVEQKITMIMEKRGGTHWGLLKCVCV